MVSGFGHMDRETGWSKHMHQNSRTNGILAIALAAVLFGAAGAFAKLLFTVRVSPLDLTAIRTIIALLVFALFLMATSRSSLGFRRAHVPILLASGVTFTAVNITFYTAISKISVAAAITLEYTAPFFVLLISVASGMRRLRAGDLSLVLIAILGCLLLTGTGGTLFSASQGVLWGLACGLSFGVFNMIGNACKDRGIGATTVTFHSFLVSACIWLPVLPFLSIDTIPITAETIFFVGFICVVATIIPYWLLMYGLRQVDALPATIIGMLDPVAAGVIAWFLVGERLTLGNMAGICIIITAVTMASFVESGGKTFAGNSTKGRSQ
jgi:DME family drug/metabolite transporter